MGHLVHGYAGMSMQEQLSEVGVKAKSPRLAPERSPEKGLLPSALRVAVIEDDPVIREFLCTALGAAEGFAEVDAYACGADAAALLVRRPVDVALVDLHLPGESGPEVIQKLLFGGCCRMAIVLTGDGSDEAIRGALLAGADGYLLKAESLEQVVAVLRECRHGVPPIGARAVDFLIRQVGPPPEAPTLAGLSRRENEVLALLAAGMGTRKVAERLGVNHRTVYKHNRQILRKLGVSRRLEAIQVYQRRLAAGTAG